jgi:hypothetical protein
MKLVEFGVKVEEASKDKPVLDAELCNLFAVLN